MKRKLFIVSLLVFISFYSSAQQLAGMNISYRYAGQPLKYILDVELFRDCSSIPAPANVKICYSSLSYSFSDTLILPVVGPGVEIVDSCYLIPPVVTTCNGGTGYGIEVYHYVDTVTLLFTASDWKFSHSRPYYSNGINSVGGEHVETFLSNLNLSVNSSPRFINENCFGYCVNNPSLLNVSCYEPDGDSLSYSFMPYYFDIAQTCPVSSLVPSTNISYPFFANNIPSSTSFVLDSITGFCSFTPNLIGTYWLSCVAKEYRNSQLIGSVEMLHQVNVIAGCIIGINDSQHSNETASVFPTVFSNETKVYINTEAKLKNTLIKVFDLSGKLVRQQLLNSQITTFQKEKLSSGSYFFQVENDGKIINRVRIVII